MGERLEAQSSGRSPRTSRLTPGRGETWQSSENTNVRLLAAARGAAGSLSSAFGLTLAPGPQLACEGGGASPWRGVCLTSTRGVVTLTESSV